MVQRQSPHDSLDCPLQEAQGNPLRFLLTLLPCYGHQPKLRQKGKDSPSPYPPLSEQALSDCFPCSLSQLLVYIPSGCFLNSTENEAIELERLFRDKVIMWLKVSVGLV